MDQMELLKNLIRDLNRLVVTIESGHPIDMFDDNGKPTNGLKTHLDRAQADLKELEVAKNALLERETWIYEMAGEHKKYLEEMAKAALALHCKDCGGSPVLRRRKVDSMPFFGCSGFPDCKASFKIADIETQIDASFIPWLKGKRETEKSEVVDDDPAKEMTEQIQSLIKEMGITKEAYDQILHEVFHVEGFKGPIPVTREILFRLTKIKMAGGKSAPTEGTDDRG